MPVSVVSWPTPRKSGCSPMQGAVGSPAPSPVHDATAWPVARWRGWCPGGTHAHPRCDGAGNGPLIGRLFHVSYTVAGMWRLLKRHGWLLQQPAGARSNATTRRSSCGRRRSGHR
ncbi:winged helix-turn-helix domain-containing protein [Streptomyces sp. NPDC058718]|uniref:helix-turn-helix domain-containing protein n=1 Tax=Streptomyces sp. NPDC058718 TaxID=3346610 RepID=UPI0036A87A1A